MKSIERIKKSAAVKSAALKAASVAALIILFAAIINATSIPATDTRQTNLTETTLSGMKISTLQYKGAGGDYELLFTVTNIPTSFVTVGVEKRHPTNKSQSENLPLIVKMYTADKNGGASGNAFIGALDEAFDYYLVVISGSEQTEILITDSSARVGKTNTHNRTSTTDSDLVELKQRIAVARELLEETLISEDGEISNYGKKITANEWWATWQIFLTFQDAILSAQEAFDCHYDFTTNIWVKEGQTFDFVMAVFDAPADTNLLELSYDPKDLEFVDLSETSVGTVDIVSHDSINGFIVFSYDNTTSGFSGIICNMYFAGLTTKFGDDVTSISTRTLE